MAVHGIDARQCQTPCTRPWPGAHSALTAIDPLQFDPARPGSTQALYAFFEDCCEAQQQRQFCGPSHDVYQIPDALSPFVVCESADTTAQVHFFTNSTVGLADHLTGMMTNYTGFPFLFSFSSSAMFELNWNLQAHQTHDSGFVGTTRNTYSLTLRSHEPTLSAAAHSYLQTLQDLTLNQSTLKTHFYPFFRDMGVLLYRRSTMGCRQSALWFLEQAKLSASMQLKLSAEAKASFLFFMRAHGAVVDKKTAAASWFLDAGFNVTDCLGGASCDQDWDTWTTQCAQQPAFLHGDHVSFVSDYIPSRTYPGLGPTIAWAQSAYLVCGSLRSWILPQLDRFADMTSNDRWRKEIRTLNATGHAWTDKECLHASQSDQQDFSARLRAVNRALVLDHA